MAAFAAPQMKISTFQCEADAMMAMKPMSWRHELSADAFLQHGFEDNEVPSAAVSTAVASDEGGSVHDESSSSAAAGDSSEGLLADSDDEEMGEAKTPSKSARRRMRRRRQRDAIHAAAHLRGAEALHQAPQSPWYHGGVPAPICTTPLGKTPLSPLSSAPTMVPPTPASPLDSTSFPSTPLSMQEALSPMAKTRANFSAPTTPAAYGIPMSPACCSTPSSILSAPSMGTFNVMGTNPYNNAVIRGDAACRSPAVATMPSAPQIPHPYIATPAPFMATQMSPMCVSAAPQVPLAAPAHPVTVVAPAPAAPLPPVAEEMVAPAPAAPLPPVAEDPVKSTLRLMLGYDITTDTRENMVAKLQAAATAAVYHD